MIEFKLSYEEAKIEILDALEAGRTPCLWGGPGIGKSTLGREIAEELGAKLYILDAPLLQPFDYAIAVPDHQNKKVVLYTTGFLPEKGPAVVLIEDLPHAKQYQQIPLMQIVLDRRIGNMHFESDVYFIITANREEDLAGITPFISPLNNRLVHIPMEANPQNWIVWAKSAGIFEPIIGFISYKPSWLYRDPEEGKKAWPTPRSWHAFADLLSAVAKKRKIDDTTLRRKGIETVGQEATTEFVTWYKYLQSVDPRQIVESGLLPSNNDRGYIFAVVQSVASLLKTKNTKYFHEYKNQILAFFRWLPGEFKIVFLEELIVYGKNRKPNLNVLQGIVSLSDEMHTYVMNILNSDKN